MHDQHNFLEHGVTGMVNCSLHHEVDQPTAALYWHCRMRVGCTSFSAPTRSSKSGSQKEVSVGTFRKLNIGMDFQKSGQFLQQTNQMSLYTNLSTTE